MNLGTFTKKADGSFTGRIECAIPYISSDVVFQPVTDKPTKDAPDFRVLIGKAELGAAWKKEHGNVEGGYQSVKLDAPGLSASINCALFENKDGTYRLVWERAEPKVQQQ